MLRIHFIDGEKRNRLNQNYMTYAIGGRIHSVVGCMIYQGKDIVFFMKEIRQEVKDNVIYIVKQENKSYQLLILIHELSHWLVSKFTQKRYLHNLIDKYL